MGSPFTQDSLNLRAKVPWSSFRLWFSPFCITRRRLLSTVRVRFLGRCDFVANSQVRRSDQYHCTPFQSRDVAPDGTKNGWAGWGVSHLERLSLQTDRALPLGKQRSHSSKLAILMQSHRHVTRPLLGKDISSAEGLELSLAASRSTEEITHLRIRTRTLRGKAGRRIGLGTSSVVGVAFHLIRKRDHTEIGVVAPHDVLSILIFDVSKHSGLGAFGGLSFNDGFLRKDGLLL